MTALASARVWPCTMHGFPHSMRDRLRAVECPADIVDQIGGWQTGGVGHGYGSGYPLEVLRKGLFSYLWWLGLQPRSDPAAQTDTSGRCHMIFKRGGDPSGD